MRAGEVQRVHRREDRFGIVVAAGAFARRVAVAITGIVERKGTPRLAEILELRMPHALVRADAVQKHEWRCITATGLVIADHPAAIDLHP